MKTQIFALALIPSMALAAGVANADEITVAAWGGSYQDALRASFFTPAAEALGITVNEENLSTGLADIRLQVRGNAVRWDLVDLAAEECIAGSKEGLFEAIDYDIVDADGIPENLVRDDWVGLLYYATVLSHNVNAEGAIPSNWQEFFDAEAFPGRRSLGSYPSETLTMAAMADGTPIDEVYPVDIDKAFAKLEEIKPEIVAWWGTGTQATTLLVDREVDFGTSWNGRITTLKSEGAPVDFILEGGVLNADCIVIPKGAPNRDLAMQAMALFISPDLQANLPRNSANGPVNAKAFETGKLTEEARASVISAPENLEKMVVIDPDFWGDKMVDVQARWQMLVQ